MYIDALIMKIRDKGVVQNKAVYTVMGIAPDGRKGRAGLLDPGHRGREVLAEHPRRAPTARGAGHPGHLCRRANGHRAKRSRRRSREAIPDVHRAHDPQRTRLVPWKDRKAVCADLRPIYTAADEAAALQALEAFETTWGKRFPMVAPAWRVAGPRSRRFWLSRRRCAARSTRPTRSSRSTRMLRKSLKTRGHMPNDDAALKLLFLATRHAKTRRNKSRDWTTALVQFAIFFEGRFKL